jgi:hypothetical protein
LEAIELGAAKHEMDGPELGSIKSAGRALDAAFDLEPARR